jgi:hypothetical protein
MKKSWISRIRISQAEKDGLLTVEVDRENEESWIGMEQPLFDAINSINRAVRGLDLNAIEWRNYPFYSNNECFKIINAK